MRDREWIRDDNKAASRLARKGDDDRFDLAVAGPLSQVRA
jgi:hypothetical protein